MEKKITFEDFLPLKFQEFRTSTFFCFISPFLLSFQKRLKADLSNTMFFLKENIICKYIILSTGCTPETLWR